MFIQIKKKEADEEFKIDTKVNLQGHIKKFDCWIALDSYKT